MTHNVLKFIRTVLTDKRKWLHKQKKYVNVVKKICGSKVTAKFLAR